MSKTVNLSESNVKQTKDFLDSFDVVLSDCDGVIWYLEQPIAGAMSAANAFQNLGKKLYLVTNNATISNDRYCEQMQLNGLNIKPDQIINTSRVIAWYLKKIQFSGEAYVIASKAFRQTLIDAGIRVAPQIEIIEGNTAHILKAIADRPSIEAVIVDFCPHFDWAKTAFAVSCLKRKEVLYICGATDEWIATGLNKTVLGPGPFIDIISKQSKRTPINCAKPSNVLKDFVLETCGIKDPKRCLFIGDSIKTDMRFSALCGFKKLLVGTGLDDIKDAKQEEETMPDFYILSLGLLHPIIDSIYDSKEVSNNHCR